MNLPIRFSRRWLLPTLLAFCAGAVGSAATAAEVIPAKPTRYFNDYTLTVKPETAERLNTELRDFEQQTSNQIVVCIYPKMQTDSDIADYDQRTARSWGVGQKDKRNGAVLFIYLENHKVNIQTGYGLEGALPDATCEEIIANDIRPRFKAGDYDGGVTAGVHAMIAATKGEYKGTGQTDYQKQHPAGGNTGGSGLGIGGIIFLIIIFIVIFSSSRRGGGGGTLLGGAGPMLLGGLLGGGGGFGGGGGGGSGGGGGGGGGDSGGFSSGGGDFGGGGASGDW